MSVCTPCQNKQRIANWHLANPGRKYELRKQWFEKNPEKTSASKVAWQKRNPEKTAARAAAWRASNPERAKSIRLRYYQNNREKCIQLVQNRNAAFRTPSWADMDAIANVYAEARRLTRQTGIEHHVDHVVPRLGKNVCGLHVETNLAVITAYDNRRKSNKFQEGNP